MSFFQDYLDDLVFEKIAADDRFSSGALGVGGLGAAGLMGAGAYRAHRAQGQLGLMSEARGMKKKDFTGKAKKRGKKLRKAQKAYAKDFRSGRLHVGKPHKSMGRFGSDMLNTNLSSLSGYSARKGTRNAIDAAFEGKMGRKAFMKASKGIKKKEYARAMGRLGNTRLGLGIGAAGAAGLGGYGAYRAYQG
jgi:hypothetical protein